MEDIIFLLFFCIMTSVFLVLVAIVIYLIWYKQPVKIRFILTTDKASSPTKGTTWSAGYDLTSSEECVILPRSRKTIKTGIKVILPYSTYGRIASRSGLSFTYGIEVGAGVIDEDYRNELRVILHNHSDEEFKVCEGDRIAQLIVEKIVYPIAIVEDVNGLVKVNNSCIRTVRGIGDFGSTGIN